jgi:hypothetical protein
MYTSPEFLTMLGIAAGVGLFTAFWITRSLRGALKEMQRPEKLVEFWTAVVQLCAVLFPLITVFLVQETNIHGNRTISAASVVVGACCGAVMALILSAVLVGWATSEWHAAAISPKDHNELRQLLYRMRDFRAHEIVRSSELAEKTDQVEAMR